MAYDDDYDLSDFKSLPPVFRSVALVGQFLQFWALMEDAMASAIQEAFGLSGLQATILTKNISLRDKLNILKSVVDLCHPDDPKPHKKVFEDIGDLAPDRNMLAHDVFDSDDQGDGVRFLVAKAKTRVTFPDTRWSIATFAEKCNAIRRHTTTIDEMKERMRLFSIYASALTSNAFLPRGQPDPRDPQPQRIPSLSQFLANPERYLETLPPPRAKEDPEKG